MIISDALLEADPWLRCCVLAAVRESAGRMGKARLGLMESVQRCCNDINPLVRETALWALEDLQAYSQSRRQIGGTMLKAIEKALLLQEFELLRFASADQLMQLAEVSHEEAFRAGDTLLRLDEPARDSFSWF